MLAHRLNRRACIPDLVVVAKRSSTSNEISSPFRMAKRQRISPNKTFCGASGKIAHCEFSLRYPKPKCGIGRTFPRRIRHNRRGSSQAEPRREPHINLSLLQRVL